MGCGAYHSLASDSGARSIFQTGVFIFDTFFGKRRKKEKQKLGGEKKERNQKYDDDARARERFVAGRDVRRGLRVGPQQLWAAGRGGDGQLSGA